MKEDSAHGIIFSEVLNGYSALVRETDKSICYLKHPSYLDRGELDSKYSLFLKEATSNGMPLYKDRETFIIKEKLWSQNDELEMVQYEQMIQNLRINYSKSYLDSKRILIKEQINDYSKIVNRLKIKKNHYIGQTAEQWANGKILHYRISNLFFRDKKFSVAIIDQETDDETFDELIKMYYLNQEKICDEAIKRISLSQFFTSIFYLCSDDAYQFYGKPIIHLTEHQVNLFTYGRYFKSILSQRDDIPKDVMTDPDEIINWIELRTNAEKAKVLGDESSQGSTSIVGATKEDYRKLGIDIGKGGSNLSKALKKSGGTLSAEQLMGIEV